MNDERKRRLYEQARLMGYLNSAAPAAGGLAGAAIGGAAGAGNPAAIGAGAAIGGGVGSVAGAIGGMLEDEMRRPYEEEEARRIQKMRTYQALLGPYLR